MLELIKKRCGIAPSVKIYDEDIMAYMEDCKSDMKASGVPESIAMNEQHEGTVTAMTMYVKAYLAEDTAETEKYLELYRKKVFRLTLEEG